MYIECLTIKCARNNNRFDRAASACVTIEGGGLQPETGLLMMTVFHM